MASLCTILADIVLGVAPPADESAVLDIGGEKACDEEGAIRQFEDV